MNTPEDQWAFICIRLGEETGTAWKVGDRDRAAKIMRLFNHLKTIHARAATRVIRKQKEKK